MPPQLLGYLISFIVGSAISAVLSYNIHKESPDKVSHVSTHFLESEKSSSAEEVLETSSNGDASSEEENRPSSIPQNESLPFQMTSKPDGFSYETPLPSSPYRSPFGNKQLPESKQTVVWYSGSTSAAYPQAMEDSFRYLVEQFNRLPSAEQPEWLGKIEVWLMSLLPEPEKNDEKQIINRERINKERLLVPRETTNLSDEEQSFPPPLPEASDDWVTRMVDGGDPDILSRIQYDQMREIVQGLHNWYHSRNRRSGDRVLASVFDEWKKLITKDSLPDLATALNQFYTSVAKWASLPNSSPLTDVFPGEINEPQRALMAIWIAGYQQGLETERRDQLRQLLQQAGRSSPIWKNNTIIRITTELLPISRVEQEAKILSGTLTNMQTKLITNIADQLKSLMQSGQTTEAVQLFINEAIIPAENETREEERRTRRDPSLYTLMEQEWYTLLFSEAIALDNIGNVFSQDNIILWQKAAQHKNKVNLITPAHNTLFDNCQMAADGMHKQVRSADIIAFLTAIIQWLQLEWGEADPRKVINNDDWSKIERHLKRLQWMVPSLSIPSMPQQVPFIRSPLVAQPPPSPPPPGASHPGVTSQPAASAVELLNNAREECKRLGYPNAIKYIKAQKWAKANGRAVPTYTEWKRMGNN
jgi:hypothetical protein